MKSIVFVDFLILIVTRIMQNRLLKSDVLIGSVKKSRSPPKNRIGFSRYGCFLLRAKRGRELGASDQRERACRRQENSPVNCFAVDEANATSGGLNEPKKSSGQKKQANFCAVFEGTTMEVSREASVI